MKKKQRCFLNRFAALVAALVISFSLPVSALAASDTEADMPSEADFKSHYGSWFVWRSVELSGNSFYELTGSPLFFNSSGSLLSNSGFFNYKTSFFDINLISGSSNYGFACAYPVPFFGSTGRWSELPAFPVGSSSSSARVRLYSVPTMLELSSYSCFLSPVYSASDRSAFYSSASGSQTDSFSPGVFPAPFYSYPFAFRVNSENNTRSYAVQGGSSDSVLSSKSSDKLLSFSASRFVTGTSSFVPPYFGYTCSSTNLGLVVIDTSVVGSGGLISSASQYAPASAPFLSATLLVPASMLPDVKVGDWFSDSPEDLQKALTNEFGVDSGTLKNSKDNLNSWNSTSSVDSDVSSTASGLLGGVFQNLGTFLFSVSLLCFGAVVIRMLIKKAVSG